MKRGKRILIGVGCALLLIVSWGAAVTAKSNTEKQSDLIAQAAAYTEDEIYILAVPLLEEAAGYNTAQTLEAEAALKEVYRHLFNRSGYQGKYTALLEKQMSRDDAAPEIFLEAAEYYLDQAKPEDALTVLRTGVDKTGSEDVRRMYDDNRYQYSMGTNYYQDVTLAYAGMIQVKENGLWGLATAAGKGRVPCEYDKVSTYSNGRALVLKDGVISAVDGSNNRVALLHGNAEDFGNLANKRASLKIADSWVLTNEVLAIGSLEFEEIGMYSNGYAPAKQSGKWGVMDVSGSEWLIPAEYDDIVRDELGRCLAQDAVFVRRGQQVFLLVGGEQIAGPFDDARPFSDGWAAVKKGEKWGFIDTDGSVKIDYQFDDALSFGQHLAAIRIGDDWGYVSRYGEIVIEPQFLAAKSFYDGSAPVQTRDGWRFITLTEYMEGAGLL